MAHTYPRFGSTDLDEKCYPHAKCFNGDYFAEDYMDAEYVVEKYTLGETYPSGEYLGENYSLDEKRALSEQYSLDEKLPLDDQSSIAPSCPSSTELLTVKSTPTPVPVCSPPDTIWFTAQRFRTFKFMGFKVEILSTKISVEDETGKVAKKRLREVVVRRKGYGVGFTMGDGIDEAEKLDRELSGGDL